MTISSNHQSVTVIVAGRLTSNFAAKEKGVRTTANPG